MATFIKRKIGTMENSLAMAASHLSNEHRVNRNCKLRNYSKVLTGIYAMFTVGNSKTDPASISTIALLDAARLLIGLQTPLNVAIDMFFRLTGEAPKNVMMGVSSRIKKRGPWQDEYKVSSEDLDPILMELYDAENGVLVIPNGGDKVSVTTPGNTR